MFPCMIKKRFNNKNKLVWKDEMYEITSYMKNKTILRATGSVSNSVSNRNNSDSSGFSGGSGGSAHKEHAVTHVECIKLLKYIVNNQSIPISIVKLHPITGFTHQLRYQCMKHGYPIVGDKTYGNFHMNRIVHNKVKVTNKVNKVGDGTCTDDKANIHVTNATNATNKNSYTDSTTDIVIDV